MSRDMGDSAVVAGGLNQRLPPLDAVSSHASSIKSEDGHASVDDTNAPPKKRQKRNKPTLSCEECVERKTKVREASVIVIAQKLAV